MSKVILLISVFLLLSSCGYKGDGHFESNGVWPLQWYTLELPEFPFESESHIEFESSGFKSVGGTSLLRLELSGGKQYDFHELDTQVEIRIVDRHGVIYFLRRGPLNGHLVRMEAEGEPSWPRHYEWEGNYRYADRRSKNLMISFIPGQTPLASDSITYSHIFPSRSRSFRTIITIGSVPDRFDGLRARLSLHSSWK